MDVLTRAVLRAAAEFASGYQAELSLVHIVETPAPSLEIDFSPYAKDIIEAADSRLKELKARLQLNVPHVVIDAPVADGIRQEAVRTKASLVVTGRGHAQAGLGRMWSSLYSIVRESPCPVLSI